MHELSLAEGVAGIIGDYAAKEGFGRVKTIWLEIGQLAGVEAEALCFALDSVLRGTVAEGATVEIVDVPGKAWCLGCGTEVAVAARYEPCPLCGDHRLQVTGGTEMRVRELAVE